MTTSWPNAPGSCSPCSIAPATAARTHLTHWSVLDHILAPMYIRVLFGAGPLTPDYVDGLVDRLLA